MTDSPNNHPIFGLLPSPVTCTNPDASLNSTVVVPADDCRYTSHTRSPSATTPPSGGTTINVGVVEHVVVDGTAGSMVGSERSTPRLDASRFEDGGQRVTSRSSMSSAADASVVRTPTSVTLLEIPSTEGDTSPADEAALDPVRKFHHSKWGKLRQTVKATTVFASAVSATSGAGGSSAHGGDDRLGVATGGGKIKKQRSQHQYDTSRRDSFLERFSTRQSGCSSAAAAAMSNSACHQQSGLMRQTSEAGRESAADGKVGSNGGSEPTVPLLSPSTGSCSYAITGGGMTSTRRRHLSSTSAKCRRISLNVISPDGTFVFAWLTVLTIAVLYNLWTCIAREAFPEIRSGGVLGAAWILADVVADLVYLIDIGVQMRTGYLEGGLVVYDPRRLAARYIRSRNFALDVTSLVPLDFVQFRIGVHPLIRFPRFLKAYRLYRFVYMVETRTVFPNLWRVANLSHVLFLGCHWFAAFYFMISDAGGYQGHWGYPNPEGEWSGVAKKYLRSLHWSTLTLTTIGDLSPPETNWEYLFTIVSYLIGVFVFATIVGQVGNVITNRNACRQEFERHLDGAKAYMRSHNVPREMQQRVQRWYDYAWTRGRINGGGDINSLGLLPDKLKTELALHVNLETLRKVTIFHECEPEFLHDLVLKMKAYIFTPGDLICRKGEVAREMFIIADGLVEVISETGEVLTQMNAGNFFGEIGILNLDGGINRRTADVRSVGYSELFVLSREDVLAALKDHPEAEVLIKEYGHKRLQQLDEHKRRRLMAQAATATTENTKGGAVMMMVGSSTGLLKGMVELGIATATLQLGPAPVASTSGVSFVGRATSSGGNAELSPSTEMSLAATANESLPMTGYNGRTDRRPAWLKDRRQEDDSVPGTASPRTTSSGRGQCGVSKGSSCLDDRGRTSATLQLRNGWPSKPAANKQILDEQESVTSFRQHDDVQQANNTAVTSATGESESAKVMNKFHGNCGEPSRSSGDQAAHLRSVTTGSASLTASNEAAGKSTLEAGTSVLTLGKEPKIGEVDPRTSRHQLSRSFRLSVASDGDVSPTGNTSWTSHSAARKTDIVDGIGTEDLRLRPATISSNSRQIECWHRHSRYHINGPKTVSDVTQHRHSDYGEAFSSLINISDINPSISDAAMGRLQHVDDNFHNNKRMFCDLLSEKNGNRNPPLGTLSPASSPEATTTVTVPTGDWNSSPTFTEGTGEVDNLCVAIGHQVATYARQQLVARLALYDRHVCRLEEENARKQLIIDRLRLALGE